MKQSKWGSAHPVVVWVGFLVNWYFYCHVEIWKHNTFGVSVSSKKKGNIGLYTDSQSQQGKPNLGITVCPRTDNSKGSVEMILHASWTQEKSSCITSKIQLGWSGTSGFGSQAFVQRMVLLWFCSTASKLSVPYCSPAQSVLREQIQHWMSVVLRHDISLRLELASVTTH